VTATMTCRSQLRSIHLEHRGIFGSFQDRRFGTARRSIRRQRGTALIVALFVLVVLAALGAFAVRMNMMQQHDADLDMQEQRAQAALSAGIEYAAARLLAGPGDNCPTLAPIANLPGGYSVAFVGATPCSMTPYVVNLVPVRVYIVNVEASRGVYGTPEFVLRRAIGVQIVG
jgi:MSHA biogenesis protein MshP